MITPLVAAAVLAAGGPAPTTVAVADLQFAPASVKVAVGSTVSWEFGDAMAHTATSDQGFWDSGTQTSGDTYTHTFRSAGTFAYRCTFHPSMRGKVRVPVSATGTSKAGWNLRWSTDAVDGELYDVQVRVGKGAWSDLRSDTRATSMRFWRLGTWSVRARTVDGQPSAWSPVVKVTSN